MIRFFFCIEREVIAALQIEWNLHVATPQGKIIATVSVHIFPTSVSHQTPKKWPSLPLTLFKYQPFSASVCQWFTALSSQCSAIPRVLDKRAKIQLAQSLFKADQSICSKRRGVYVKLGGHSLQLTTRACANGNLRRRPREDTPVNRSRKDCKLYSSLYRSQIYTCTL